MFVIVKNHLSIGLCLSFVCNILFLYPVGVSDGFLHLAYLLRTSFGSGNSTRKGEQRRQTNSNTSGHRSTTTTARDDDDDRTPYVHRKKIFAKDEGEYVDYEEAK